MTGAQKKAKSISIRHERFDWLTNLKAGDQVERKFSVQGPGIAMVVTQIIPTRIICGSYVFDAATGAEINEELGWGTDGTGSYLCPPAR